MITVNVPGKGQIQFDDGTPDDEIESVIDQEFPRTGEDVRESMMMDPEYDLTLEDYKLYEDYQKSRTLGSKVEEGLEMIPGVIDHLGTVLGDGIVGAFTSNPLKAPANLAEGFFQGTKGLWQMVAHSENPDAVMFGLKDFLFGDGTVESRFEQTKKALDFRRGMDRNLTGEETVLLPKDWVDNRVVQATALVADPTLFAGVLTGGASTLMGAGGKLGRFRKVAEMGNMAAQKATQKMVNAAGTGLRVAAAPVTRAVDAAGKAVEAVTGVAPRNMHAGAVALGGAGVVNPATATAGAVVLAAEGADIVGDALQRISRGLSGQPSRIGALESVAMDVTAPQSVRSFARAAHALGGDTALDLSLRTASGAAAGAAVGSLMGYGYDDVQGGIAGAGAGSMMGAAGAGLFRSIEHGLGRVEVEGQRADAMRWVSSITNPKHQERAATAAAIMEAQIPGSSALLADADIAMRAIGGEVRFIDEATSKRIGGQDAAQGFFRERGIGDKPTLFLNLDTFGKTTAAHETVHALLKTVAGGEQLAAARDILFGTISPDGTINGDGAVSLESVRTFAEKYRDRMTGPAKDVWDGYIRDAFNDGLELSQRLEAQREIADEFTAYYGGYASFSKGLFGKTRYNNSLMVGKADTAIGVVLKNARRFFEGRTRRQLKMDFTGASIESPFAAAKNPGMKRFVQEVMAGSRDMQAEGNAATIRYNMRNANKGSMQALADAGFASAFVRDAQGKVIRQRTVGEEKVQLRAQFNAIRDVLINQGIDPQTRLMVNEDGTQSFNLGEIFTGLDPQKQVALMTALERFLGPSHRRFITQIASQMSNRNKAEFSLTYWAATTRSKKDSAVYASLGASERNVVPYAIEVSAEGGVYIRALDMNAIQKRFEKAWQKSGRHLYRKGERARALSEFNDYLDNLTQDNPVPSADLKIGGVKLGEDKRNFFYEVLGTVPSQANRPPMDRAPRRGYVPDHATDKAFKSFRVDRMAKLDMTGKSLSFTEDGTYRRSQANFMVKEPASRRGVMRYSSIDEDSRFMVGAGNPVSQRVAKDYVSRAGIPYRPHATYLSAPVDNLIAIADWHQNAKHEPASQDVQESYGALSREVMAQYDEMVRNGLKAEPWEQDGEPYANSLEMMADVQQNNHMWFFRTENGFGEVEGIAGDHPMLEKTGVSINGRELLLNDVFRIVHDYFGHTQNGFQFGPRGEYNAYKEHAAMFSEAAQGALAAETLAQNAWVNYGRHIRRKDGTIPQNGDSDFVPPMQRPFAEQKATVVPKDMRFMVADKRSYLDLVDSALDNPSSDNFVDTDVYEGGKVRSIAKMFADTMAGVRKLRPSNSGFGKAGDRIVDLLDRAMYEFPNFASWYEGKIKEAMDVFTELDPDLVKPENKSALTLLLAVTSNGAKVFEQTVDAWAIYKHFKQTGNVSGFSGGRGSSRAEAVSTHLRMIDDFSSYLGGMDKVGEFMSRKGTVKELREALVQELGHTRKEATMLTGGELIDEVVPFSLVFGAKLGSFFNNLNGDFTTVTMDRWFMRTFGRAMGTQLEKAVDARKRAITRFNDALENYEGSILNRAGTRKSDSIKVKNYRLWKFFTDAENRKNLTAKENDIRRAANALIKVGDGFTLREAPKNGTERRWIRNVMLDAIEKFNNKTGKNLNPAEAQALLWYYEKLIHETFGSRQDDSSPDYAAAARRVYAKERGREASTPSTENSSGIERRRDGRRGAAFGGDTAQAYQGRGGQNPSSPLNPKGGTSRFMPSDADYMKAVEAGDMEAAQQMVDEAAKARGFGVYSHRRKDGKKPSETGYVVLFADREEGRNYGYGDSEFLVDDSKLMTEVPEWMADAYREYRSDFELSREDAVIELSPDDIVDSAGAWDDPQWVSELYNFHEGKLGKFIGIKTPDGAAVWDAYEGIKSADPVTYDDNGNVISLSERFNKASDDIRFMPSDADYMKAVKGGDMEAAQRMVDEAAKRAGYTVGPVFHGTPLAPKNIDRDSFPFNEFKKGRLHEKSIWFSEKRHGAEPYARETGQVGQFYLRSAIRDGAELGAKKYRVTNPNQIKSADPITRDDAGNVIPLSERFNKASDDIRFQPKDSAKPSDQDALGLYSAAERAVKNITMKEGNGQAFLNRMIKAGVKPEELDDLGLTGLLKDNPKVTKADIEEHLQANRIEIAELQKRDKDATLSYFSEVLNDDVSIPSDMASRESITRAAYFMEHYGDTLGENKVWELHEELNAKLSEGDDYDVTLQSPTKYKEHTSPGGENYREVLLTLPKAKAAFTSAHWTEENIVAFMRMKDRVLGGKNVLALEEIQSDWHQQGKKKGYDGGEIKALRLKVNEIDQQLNRVYKLRETTRDPDAWMRLDDAEHELTVNRAGVYLQIMAAKGRGVEDAPFKLSWQDLALRRAVTMAVHEGKQMISWTTADTQATRYSMLLRAAVDEVQYIREKGFVSVRIVKDGNSVLDKDFGLDGMSRQEIRGEKRHLKELIGHKAADQILADAIPNEYRKIEGGELTLGGKGMEVFYDERLVNSKVWKQLGVKPKKVQMDDGAGEVWMVDLGGDVASKVASDGLSKYQPADDPMGAIPGDAGPVRSRVPLPILTGAKRNVPTAEEALSWLTEDKQAKGRARGRVKPGHRVGLRIDIPAYQKSNFEVYTVSVHDHEKNPRSKAGPILGYEPYAYVEGPLEFVVNENFAKRIKTGEVAKNTIAVVEGHWKVRDTVPKDIAKWTQVGMNPKRHSYFYDRQTHLPVVGGSAAFSIGGTVFVKDAVFAHPDEFLFMPSDTDTKDGSVSVSQPRDRMDKVKRVQPRPTPASIRDYRRGIRAGIQGAKQLSRN